LVISHGFLLGEVNPNCLSMLGIKVILTASIPYVIIHFEKQEKPNLRYIGLYKILAKSLDYQLKSPP
jgi:hypothetical protein